MTVWTGVDVPRKERHQRLRNRALGQSCDREKGRRRLRLPPLRFRRVFPRDEMVME
jgi:hypothetical protein